MYFRPQAHDSLCDMVDELDISSPQGDSRDEHCVTINQDSRPVSSDYQVNSLVTPSIQEPFLEEDQRIVDSRLLLLPDDAEYFSHDYTHHDWGCLIRIARSLDGQQTEPFFDFDAFQEAAALANESPDFPDKWYSVFLYAGRCAISGENQSWEQALGLAKKKHTYQQRLNVRVDGLERKVARFRRRMLKRFIRNWLARSRIVRQHSQELNVKFERAVFQRWHDQSLQWRNSIQHLTKNQGAGSRQALANIILARACQNVKSQNNEKNRFLKEVLLNRFNREISQRKLLAAQSDLLASQRVIWRVNDALAANFHQKKLMHTSLSLLRKAALFGSDLELKADTCVQTRCLHRWRLLNRDKQDATERARFFRKGQLVPVLNSLRQELRLRQFQSTDKARLLFSHWRTQLRRCILRKRQLGTFLEGWRDCSSHMANEDSSRMNLAKSQSDKLLRSHTLSALRSASETSELALIVDRTNRTRRAKIVIYAFEVLATQVTEDRHRVTRLVTDSLKRHSIQHIRKVCDQICGNVLGEKLSTYLNGSYKQAMMKESLRRLRGGITVCIANEKRSIQQARAKFGHGCLRDWIESYRVLLELSSRAEQLYLSSTAELIWDCLSVETELCQHLSASCDDFIYWVLKPQILRKPFMRWQVFAMQSRSREEHVDRLYAQYEASKSRRLLRSWRGSIRNSRADHQPLTKSTPLRRDSPWNLSSYSEMSFNRLRNRDQVNVEATPTRTRPIREREAPKAPKIL